MFDSSKQPILSYQRCNQTENSLKFKIVADDCSEIEFSITFETCMSVFKNTYCEDTEYNTFYLLFTGYHADGENISAILQKQNDFHMEDCQETNEQSFSLTPQSNLLPNISIPLSHPLHDNVTISAFEISKIPNKVEWRNLWLQYPKNFPLDAIFKEIDEHDHYVYALILLNEDYSFNRIFYIGETWYPDDRLMEHRSDNTTNDAKWDIFKSYPRSRISMRILWVDTMERCMIIENLIIQYAEELGITQLTNKSQNKFHCNFQYDVIEALKNIIHFGIEKKIGKRADMVKSTPEKLEKSRQQKIKRKSEKISNAVENLGSLPFLHSAKSLTSNTSINEKNIDFNFSFLQIPNEIRQKNIEKLQIDCEFKGAFIVANDTIIDKVAETFLNVDDIEILELMRDKCNAITLAARTGIIGNEKKCKTKMCEHQMRLEYRGDSDMFRWRCQRPGKNCSTAKLVENTIFHQNAFPLLFQIRIIFYFSRNLSGDEIVKKLGNIRNIKKTYNIINDLKSQIIDIELKKLVKNQAILSDTLRQAFLADTRLDHFGIMLSWIAENRIQRPVVFVVTQDLAEPLNAT